jgi:hypothetical protein
VPLNGGGGGSGIECLTGAAPGTHSCVVHAKSGTFVDTLSAAAAAPVTTLRHLSLDGGGGAEVIRTLHDAGAADPRVAALGPSALAPPTFHTFPSTDGKVTLQGAVYAPDPETHGPGPYPVVVATCASSFALLDSLLCST